MLDAAGAPVSVTLVEIAAFLWIAAGVLGYFVGRAGASPGCGWYVLIFFATGALGLVTFILGSILGRNFRRDEMRDQRRNPPQPQPGTSYHQSIRPPGYGTGVPTSPPYGGTPATAAPGWYPDPSDPYRQRYWDGARWTQQMQWDGSQWVPV